MLLGSMTQNPQASGGQKAAGLGLCLGALGVVFGDIGTSPLYTMKECLHHLPGEARQAGVLGILSLMFWTMMLVVSIKYVLFVTRADNRGEGGIFALLALANPRSSTVRKGLSPGVLIILVGAALLFGDGVITPAITVLGAAEGFVSFSSVFKPYIVAISVGILAAIFLIQSRGTDAIGRLFGPVMLVWFGVLALLGIWHTVTAPAVLKALNPLYGLGLLFQNPGMAVALLGSVVLTITGAEALYADMGHFGRSAIARSWAALVCPALTLNYFGQGAYALSNPTTENPFFDMAPAGPLRLALVALSIAAAIIASQALISGTFSMARQAIQLGYFPRLKILHTNAEQVGQIFVPLVNAVLAVCTIWVVIEFKSSSALAAAYGIAVTGTMAVTTFAFFQVTRRVWNWSRWKALSLCGFFLVIDLVFFGANLHKFLDGGWLPVLLGVGVLAIMVTWKMGRDEIQEKVYSGATAELELSDIAKSKNIVRVPGSAVFMVASSKGTPLALLHHLKANKCLQKTVILMTIVTDDLPHVDDEERMTLESLGEGVWRAMGRYGYMESPDVGKLVERIKNQGVPVNIHATTFYFNREMIVTGGNTRMFEWQKALYAFLSRNARPVKDYYRILPTQVIEIGLPIQL
jgi:KUP system potassium uptake protein